MKAMIYSAIGLFSVAAVYGLTDYFKSNHNGSIDNLYSESPVKGKVAGSVMTLALTATPGNEIETNIDPDTGINAGIVNGNVGRSSKNNRSIQLKSFSRAIIAEDIQPDEAIKPLPVVKEVVVKSETSTAAETSNADNKKINLKMFSRAPLRMPVKKIASKN